MNIQDAGLLKGLYGTVGAANLTLAILVLGASAMYPDRAEAWLVGLGILNLLAFGSLWRELDGLIRRWAKMG